MKRLSLIITLLLIVNFVFAQDNLPREISTQELQKIKLDIEKKIPAFKATLLKDELTNEQVEFSVDTFRIEELSSKKMEIDYSTLGMNNAIGEMADSYDKLLNKYYNKLLKTLKPVDKKTLITAQKAWLAYRDAEQELISTMSKDEYSGGGSIQSMIVTGAYTDLIVKRTIEIFNFYDSIVKDDQPLK